MSETPHPVDLRQNILQLERELKHVIQLSEKSGGEPDTFSLTRIRKELVAARQALADWENNRRSRN